MNLNIAPIFACSRCKTQPPMHRLGPENGFTSRLLEARLENAGWQHVKIGMLRLCPDCARPSSGHGPDKKELDLGR